MLYIKCTHCRHNNAIKSESILFCESCNRKLHPNFKEWHKAHPGKSFDDFATLYCLSEYDINQPPVSGKKGISSRYLVLVFLLLILAGTVAFFGVRKYMNKSLATRTNDSILSEKWVRTTVGNSGLLIDLPFQLEKQDIPLTQFTANMIDKMEGFSHISGKGFKIVTFHTVYKEGIEASLDGAVQGAVNEIQKIQGISDFSWNQAETTVSSKKAALVTINYKILEYPVRIKTLVVCSKNKLWQVISQYSEDDIAGAKASEKILNSIEIRDN
jgi:hypothetical protein